MNNITKIKILKPTNEVFDAIVDPLKIGGFWFSSSSERWQKNKTVTLKYDEYNAQVEIQIVEVEVNQKIVFKWGSSEEANVVTITLKEIDNTSTIIEVKEEGFKEDDEEIISKLLDNKEGWVYMLTCLKAYMEYGVTNLRAGLVK